ncbi:hypothetical protein PSQ90_01010 [Devosia rhodophyticola]|uniref:Secreted protein n=1 Tax=Devosia rhodophyticola TaxID=3026423 RepID=A0ABY7YY33_9HYPH|nr:hypothetical protein [Devosia rhodophyticola]WDR06072.1 hypothetical protein PSQ90_01010 [Devosia rhodophyticola]
MKPVLIAIAMICALAFALGAGVPSVSAMQGHLTVSEHGELCQVASGHTAEAVSFKPCGKKINGQATPCHQSQGLMPEVQSYCAPSTPDLFFGTTETRPIGPPAEPRLRPPKRLASA